MELPRIELASLPDLEQVAGIFGSLSPFAGGGHDDRIVVLMVYVYDTLPPEGLL